MLIINTLRSSLSTRPTALCALVELGKVSPVGSLALANSPARVSRDPTDRSACRTRPLVSSSGGDAAGPARVLSAVGYIGGPKGESGADWRNSSVWRRLGSCCVAGRSQPSASGTTPGPWGQDPHLARHLTHPAQGRQLGSIEPNATLSRRTQADCREPLPARPSAILSPRRNLRPGRP